MAAAAGLALACAAGLALAARESTEAAPPAPAPSAAPVAPLAAVSEPLPAPLPAAAASTAPAPTSPAPLPQGDLKVVTTHRGAPSWASLRVDGTPSGTTPAQLRLPVGEHEVVIERAGFKSESRQVNITADAPLALRIELRR